MSELSEKLLIKKPFANKLAFITGGSKGIGKGIAFDFVMLGGSVCLFARGDAELAQTVQELKTYCLSENQKIHTRTVDVRNPDEVKDVFTGAVKEFGVPQYLFTFAGFCIPKYIDDMSMQLAKDHMDVNYFGSLGPVLTLLPHFKEKREGHIVFAGSGVAFMGLIGYGPYAPTKFAICGLAETIRHEMKPYNVHVSVMIPPDTETPGYIVENQTKPEECKIISARYKPWSAQRTADGVIKGVLKEKFYILLGDMKTTFFVKGMAPKLLFSIIDSDLKKARKKMTRK